MNILFAEDDARVAKFVKAGLKEEGHSVYHVTNGREAVDAAKSDNFGAIILDVMMPGKDGLSVCRDLRAGGIRTPVLMLTAKDTVEDRVLGLDAGADDYLVKPFSFSELLARLRALERRAGDGSGTNVLEIGGLKLDLVSRNVLFEQKKIELTAREFALLHYMMKRKGHVLSRTVILEAVWGYDFETGTNIVDVYVNYLRQKLLKATGREMIETIRGRGYVFGTGE